MTDIDNLQINIGGSVDGAVQSINTLESSLKKLKNATKRGVGLQSLANEVDNFNESVSAETDGAVRSLNKLSDVLVAMKNIGKVTISSSLANQLTKLGNSMDAIKNIDTRKLNEVGNAIRSLDTKDIKLTPAIGNNLLKISKGLTTLEEVNISSSTDKLTKLVKSMESLKDFNARGFASALNALAKLDKVSAGLKNINLDEFRKDVTELTASLSPLSQEFGKIANVLDRMPQRFSATSKKMRGMTDAANNQSKQDNYVTNEGTFISKIGGLKSVLMRVGTYARFLYKEIKGFLGQANKYIEDVNLFSVSLGEYAEQASRFAHEASEVLGIDPSDFMRNQGLFMTLASGFGIASDRAHLMSKNLTQLGYDLSSFFNIPVEDAMAKLGSGMAGELEPLRRIGYDLSKARLEAEALSLGITKTFNDMTQAEKAQLRYLLIMKQVTVAQGDMARTLEAPSNQLRIFQAQVTMTGRAIGSIFIPALNAILPYAIAAMRVIRDLAETIANFLGVKLPKVDFESAYGPNVKQNVSDLELPEIKDPLDGMANSSKKLSKGLKDNKKKLKDLRATVLSFDELHILNDNPKKDDPISSRLPGGSGRGRIGGGKGKGKGGGSWKDFDLPQYDFLKGATSQRVDKIVRDIKSKLKPLWKYINDNLDSIKATTLAIGAGFLAWKIGKSVTDFFTKDKDGVSKFGDLIKNFKKYKKAIGIGLMVTGFTLEGSAGYSIGYNGFNLKDAIKGAIGAGMGVAGSLLVFGTGPLGWTVGLGIAVTVGLVSILMGKSAKTKADDLKKRFGDKSLTDEELGVWAKKLTANMTVSKIELALDKAAEVEDLEGKIKESVENINQLELKLAAGLEVNYEEYKSEIDNFKDVGQKYIDEQHLAVKLAFEASGHTELGAEWDQYWISISKEYEKAGKELSDTVADAYNKGKWDLDTVKKVQQLRQHMIEIQQQMRKFETKSNLNQIMLEFDIKNLDSDSFSRLSQKLKEERKKSIDSLNKGAGMEIAAIDLMYETKIKNASTEKEKSNLIKERDDAKKLVKDTLEANKIDLDMQIESVKLEGLENAYAKPLENTTTLMQNRLKGSLSDMYKETFGYLPDDFLFNISKYKKELEDRLNTEFNQIKIDGKVKQEGLDEMLINLTFSSDELESKRDYLISIGKKVPESLTQGIKDTKALEMLRDSTSGVKSTLNNALSFEDPDVKSFLEKAKEDGIGIDDKFIEGIKEKAEDAGLSGTDLVEYVVGEVGKQLNASHSDLRAQGHKIPEDMNEGIKKGANENFSESNVGAWVRGIATTINSVWKQSKPNMDQEANFKINTTYNTTHNFFNNLYERVISGFKQPVYNGGRKNVLEHRATGGFVEQGDMFIANEAGPELIGTIGNKTAVVNNNQIVESVSKGVAQAVSSVLGGGDQGDIILIVQTPNDVTGKEIYRQNIAKARREGRTT